MKIDLRAYAAELAFWIDAFKPFVAKESAPALTRLQEQIENGRDNLRPSFPWKLAAPIKSIDADRYDGKDRSPHKVRIGWQFEACFESGPESRRQYMWKIETMVTQIKVYSCADETVISHFHFDLRNEKQLGPHTHLQISEHFQKDRGRIPLAVPRFPAAPLLPTDCLDLVLNEFFPFEWPESQVQARGRTMLRKRQQDRMLRMSQALTAHWGRSLNTPIVATQSWYVPNLQIA